jgi:hypothetical protein
MIVLLRTYLNLNWLLKESKGTFDLALSTDLGLLRKIPLKLKLIIYPLRFLELFNLIFDLQDFLIVVLNYFVQNLIFLLNQIIINIVLA